MNTPTHTTAPIIRLATAADEAAIRDCAEKAYSQYVPVMSRRPAPMDADYTSEIASRVVYVAEDAAGAFQGFIIFFAVGKHVLLENVAVLPAAAGKGVGRALVGFCETETRRLGLDTVVLYTNEKMAANLSLYPRLGYLETSRRTEDGFHRVFFEKTLS